MVLFDIILIAGPLPQYLCFFHFQTLTFAIVTMSCKKRREKHSLINFSRPSWFIF